MTFAAMPIRFDEPIWLFLLLLIVPVWLLARKSIGQSRFKAVATFALRSILIAMLAVALARPVWERQGEGLTVSILLDRSLSIPRQAKADAVEFLRQAVEHKERREDRVSVISIGKHAQIESLPDSYTAVAVPPDEGDLTATNLAAGLRLAIAIMPDDTSNRIVIASDGNETVDSVLAAAEIARANHVPIDVLVLEYEHEKEIIFDEIVAPARAREGQAAEIKLVLRSQAPASGRLRLTVNGSYLDLNGDEQGDALAVPLEAGTNAFAQTITLDQARPHVFEAVFVPDDPEMDSVEENNTAMAVTFVSGQGSVLVVDDGPTQSRYLVQALRESGITVEAVEPGALVGGPVTLSAYDAVVLVNIPRWSIDEDIDRALHAYVHDLGGGLAMIGGPDSFGAGGWIDGEVAKTLPVELSPPQTRQMPAGALALIMHSCEMSQGNYWGLKVAEAAIGTLSRLDYAGIIEFSWGGGVGGFQGCDWAFPMQRLGDKGAALAAAKAMQMGDMPSFDPSMQLALKQGFEKVNAAQRHAIIISDGDPSPPSRATIQAYVDNRVTVTTVMVGGHGTSIDRKHMEDVATDTGGTFYNVTNPKQLPEIFIKEAQIVSRSLIQDGDLYQPAVVTQLPGPTQGYATVPPIDGYVLTAPRDGLAMAPIVIGTTDGNDPLFAHWNYGLGRTIAYTSDLSERWGSHWAGWSQFQAFWEQAVRWVMRPASPSNVHVSTRIEGETAIVEAEALDADASFLNLLRPSAVVLRPDATSEHTSLQQVGPGRYRMEFPVAEAGSYLVNIACRTGEGEPLMLPAAVTVPYAREFRTVKHNAALLSDLARMTGGRMLDGGDPRLVDLFDDHGLETPRSPKPVWDLLAIVAAALLLLDVAARRLSVDGRAAAAWVSRALGRRAEVGEETVAAWKRARSQVAHRGTPKKRGVAIAADASTDASAVRFEAGEGDESVSIDVSEETTPGETRPKLARPKPAKTAPGAGESDEGDYTSRLLAAKRRARGDEGEGGAGPPGAGGAGGTGGGADG